MQGVYYRSNVMRNAVIFRNDTPNFVSFFVYFGDNAGPNSVNDMLRSDAFVYEQVVPPYQTSFVDQKGRFLWVGSKVGKMDGGARRSSGAATLSPATHASPDEDAMTTK